MTIYMTLWEGDDAQRRRLAKLSLREFFTEARVRQADFETKNFQARIHTWICYIEEYFPEIVTVEDLLLFGRSALGRRTGPLTSSTITGVLAWNGLKFVS